MTVLMIGPNERAAIAVALGRARKKARPLAEVERNSVELMQGEVLTLEKRPADFAKGVSEQVNLQGYDACIRFEEQPPGLCKHLSIAVAGKRLVTPGPAAVVMIAEAFGIVRDAIVAMWIEEYEPDYLAVNMVALDKPLVQDKEKDDG